MLEEIQQIIQKYSDKKYSILTGNGTSAIYLTLMASDIPKGSFIAVPNISCPDPVYALIWAGYKPYFIDVNFHDYNIDIVKLEDALKQVPEIRAIIAIHLFGNSCDIYAIRELATQYQCLLLEDCAQAFGNEIEKGKLGSFGDVSIFSFGNGKIVEAGHGGAVVTNDKFLWMKIRNEDKKLPKYNANYVKKMSKQHRKLYYTLYGLGQKISYINILNLIFVYGFKYYYLYRIDIRQLSAIYKEIMYFSERKQKRIDIINFYRENLKEFGLPVLHNKENILSRFTIRIDQAEAISERIREYHIPSNTMYPMLVDRFSLFFDKSKFKNSFALRGKLLNLWSNDITIEQMMKTVDLLKDSYH